MAEDEPSNEFKDILAAYDIPDVSSTAQESKVQKRRCDTGASNNSESNKSKPDTIPKTNDPENLSVDRASHQLPSLHSYMEKQSDLKYPFNGLASESFFSKPRKTMEKEMDMYQVTANAMPSYVPAIPPHARANLNVPTEGIKCAECDDTFLFEHNLLEHLQRRSILIKFNCDSCKKSLIYYNNCTFRNHVRIHLERNEPADMQNATVMPLPPELMNGYGSFPMPFMSHPLMQQFHLQPSVPLMISPQNLMSTLKNSASSPKIKPSNGSMSSGHQSSPTSKCKFSCSECCQSYESPSLLEEHFGCSQNLPLGSSQCSKCNMTCASKCSLSAHERIHTDTKPYVCPECGLTLSSKEAFSHHVNKKCLHHNRVIGYKCSTCLILYSNPIEMRSHIIAEHTEAYHKCQACPMAFKAGHSLDSHKKTAHLTMDVESKTIYKCPLCDTVFEGDNNLNEHLDAHIKEQIQNIKFVFKCLTCQETAKCEELFKTKSSLREHITKNHSETLEISCSSCDAMFDSSEDLEKHLLEIHPTKIVNEPSATQTTESLSQNGNSEEKSFSLSSYNNDPQSASCVCSNCGDSFHNLNGYLTHKKTCGRLPVQCNVCQLTFERKEDMIEDGRKHLSEGILVCLLCSNNAQFESKKALFKHVEVHISENSEFKCDLCSSKYSDNKEFLKHLRSEHGFNPVKCDMCDAEFYGTARMQRHKSMAHPIKASLICPLCNDNSFKTQGFLDKHLILSHNKSLEEIAELRKPMSVQYRQSSTARIPPKIMTEAFSDGESACKSPLPSTNDDNGINAEDNCSSPVSKKRAVDLCQDQNILTCSKCQFVSHDRSVFSEHIATHKVDSSAYQCWECGSCYATIPSLRKHMFLGHGIRDFQTHMSKVGPNMITNVEDFTSKNGNSFNCDVCCQSFSSESSLKNHMRNHGMAFVKSHSTSLGSSENDAERSN